MDGKLEWPTEHVHYTRKGEFNQVPFMSERLHMIWRYIHTNYTHPQVRVPPLVDVSTPTINPLYSGVSWSGEVTLHTNLKLKLVKGEYSSPLVSPIESFCSVNSELNDMS